MQDTLQCSSIADSPDERMGGGLFLPCKSGGKRANRRGRNQKRKRNDLAGRVTDIFGAGNGLVPRVIEVAAPGSDILSAGSGLAPRATGVAGAGSGGLERGIDLAPCATDGAALGNGVSGGGTEFATKKGHFLSYSGRFAARLPYFRGGLHRITTNKNN